jgi:hypothetical protein
MKFLFCLFYNKGKQAQISTNKYFSVFLMTLRPTVSCQAGLEPGTHTHFGVLQPKRGELVCFFTQRLTESWLSTMDVLEECAWRLRSAGSSWSIIDI